MPPTPRTSWSESHGNGIRREHRLWCDASNHRIAGRRCACPYSFWMPRSEGAKRHRARVYGSLADARHAKRDAEHAAEQLRRTRANQLAGITTIPTLDAWFDALLHREWRRVRVSTRERRQIDYRRLTSALGAHRLDRLTVPAVHAWLHDTIDRDGNRRCVQAALETLEAMLAIAVEHRLVAENAAKLVRYPVEQMQRRMLRVLSHDEYRQLLTACRNVRERSLVRILCEAGLRRSEAVALQVGDLDLASGLVHIQRRHYRCADGTVDVDSPKSHRSRYAAINATLVAELREMIAGRENFANASVWTRCNRYTDGEHVPLTGAAAFKLLKRLGRHTGLDVSPHLLRATGASLAVAAGVPPHIAQRQLGHARIETTQRHYLRLPVIGPLRQIGAVFD
jgi:integrase